jgi:DNA-binding MarR family transcriptional regulator
VKLTQFLNHSIIAGVASAHSEIQNWLSRRTKPDVSYLGSLILLSLHFEHGDSVLGPSRMAKHFGFSRSRISQELTRLDRMGLIERSISKASARSISLRLSARGARAASELIRTFAQLQSFLDKKAGEKQAEDIAKSLNEISSQLRSYR